MKYFIDGKIKSCSTKFCFNKMPTGVLRITINKGKKHKLKDQMTMPLFFNMLSNKPKNKLQIRSKMSVSISNSFYLRMCLSPFPYQDTPPHYLQ